MNYRLATESDLMNLAKMRWDFRMEDGMGVAVVNRDKFVEACAKFLGQGLANNSWAYWIAETNNEIISHIFVQRVKKVPNQALHTTVSRAVRTEVWSAYESLFHAKSIL